MHAPAWWLPRLDLSSTPSWWSCELCHPSSSLNECSAELVLLVFSTCLWSSSQPCWDSGVSAGVWGWAKDQCHLPFCLYWMTHGSPGVCCEPRRAQNTANRVTGPCTGRWPGDRAGILCWDVLRFTSGSPASGGMPSWWCGDKCPWWSWLAEQLKSTQTPISCREVPSQLSPCSPGELLLPQQGASSPHVCKRSMAAGKDVGVWFCQGV